MLSITGTGEGAQDPLEKAVEFLHPRGPPNSCCVQQMEMPKCLLSIHFTRYITVISVHERNDSIGLYCNGWEDCGFLPF